MVRKRWIGDGQLQELEQHYIQAMYRYNEALKQGPSVASKARREMVRLEVVLLQLLELAITDPPFAHHRRLSEHQRRVPMNPPSGSSKS